jgi:beta-mannanase
VPPAAPSSSSGPVLFGAATDGGQDLGLLSQFESHAGKKVNLYSIYHSFKYSPDFDAAAASSIRAHGATPMITWEPWDPSASATSQPTYSLASIAGGTHDALITRWATQIKAWGQPLWLRFAHEMNSDWYPWAEKVNGNRPGQYVAAWRHVHDIFKQVGANNVVWIWNPNVDFPGATAMSSLYPGDAYVDWVGLDGYNWGRSTSWGTWQTFDQVFGPSLTALRQITSRPVVIGETASTELGGDKAQWISQFFAGLARNASIKAFVWFNLNKETDWRIESSAAAQRAFATGVADPRYRAA